jgi:hypothetical protein
MFLLLFFSLWYAGYPLLVLRTVTDVKTVFLLEWRRHSLHAQALFARLWIGHPDELILDHLFLCASFLQRLFAACSPTFRLARFKREQGQTKTNHLQEHPMQRSLIRERPREQRSASLLLLDAESPKAVLPARVQVPSYTKSVVHLPPPVFCVCAILEKA